MERMAIGGMLGGVPHDLVRPGFEPQRARTPRWLVWTSLSLSDLALAGLALLLLIHGHDRALVATAATPSRSPVAFVENQHLAPMLSFDPPGAGRVPARYQARMRPASGERSDALTYGEIGGDDLFFRVAIHTTISAPTAPSLFVELAKQSAELDAAVVRATSPEPYETPRGAIEWANVILSGPGGERSCVGFRLARGARAELSGLACGARASPVDSAALGCLLDRLSTTREGREAGLGDALNGDPPRPTACRGVAG
jgi:hypothetical protein